MSNTTRTADHHRIIAASQENEDFRPILLRVMSTNQVTAVSDLDDESIDMLLDAIDVFEQSDEQSDLERFTNVFADADTIECPECENGWAEFFDNGEIVTRSCSTCGGVRTVGVLKKP